MTKSSKLYEIRVFWQSFRQSYNVHKAINLYAVDDETKFNLLNPIPVSLQIDYNQAYTCMKKVNKYLFWRNKYRRSLVYSSRNFNSFFLKQKGSPQWVTISSFGKKTQTAASSTMFHTFTARSNSEHLSLISENGLLNDSRKIHGKMSEREFSIPFFTFSWRLFVHAFSVFPNVSRNWCLEFTSLVCRPHKSLSESISLDMSSSSFMVPG